METKALIAIHLQIRQTAMNPQSEHRSLADEVPNPAAEGFNSHAFRLLTDPRTYISAHVRNKCPKKV